jgi:chemotaxis protein methyltransferase CheR
MNSQDFQYLSKLLREGSGLSLTEDKTYLLESRLTPLAREKNLQDIAGLVSHLQKTRDQQLIRDINDVMTTNESMFFRDQKPFDQFRDVVLPALMEQNKLTKKLRIWCAACSNGQEPYSLAILLKELGPKLAGWNIEIIGTDLCRKVLSKAEQGIYTQFEVQRGLPIQLLVKYFQQEGNQWRIKPEIRQMVKYKELNLLDSYVSMGKFDVIFCRNVLIYFDLQGKNQILQKLCQSLETAHGGYIFLGSTEGIQGMESKLKRVENYSGLYQTI